MGYPMAAASADHWHPGADPGYDTKTSKSNSPGNITGFVYRIDHFSVCFHFERLFVSWAGVQTLLALEHAGWL
jgi:hypothetical protein